jgi:hypothetical protein
VARLEPARKAKGHEIAAELINFQSIYFRSMSLHDPLHPMNFMRRTLNETVNGRARPGARHGG